MLIAKIPFLLDRIRVGDMVVFRHPDFGIMIKQVERIGPGPNELFVIGTHPFSVDSRQFGPIERQSILGRVIWHIQKPEL